MKSELQIIKLAFWVAVAFTVALFVAQCLLQYARS